MTKKQKLDLFATVLACERIATAAHKGQLRSDGQEYITHPRAVATLCKNRVEDDFEDDPPSEHPWLDGPDNRIKTDWYYYRALAWIHDVFEDCGHLGYTLDRFDEIFSSLPQAHRDVLKPAVDAITKRDGEAYVDYLKRVCANRYARRVKEMDLQHNLLDQNDSKHKHRREKYQLALAVVRKEYF